MSSTRAYDGSRRAEAAQLTRRRLLTAARDEFLRVGYHRATIAALAQSAGVSPQTIYNTFGGKAQLLKAVYDVVLAGDDEPVPLNDRPEIARVSSQRSAAATLRAYAAVSAMLYERLGPLLGMLLDEGPGSDADLAAFLAAIDQERRIGNTGVVQHIADRFGLAEGVSVDRVVDHVWTLTSPENADRLVRRCGWSVVAYEKWLAAGLIAGVRALDT